MPSAVMVTSGQRRRSASATDSSGETCPADPPPASSTDDGAVIARAGRSRRARPRAGPAARARRRATGAAVTADRPAPRTGWSAPAFVSVGGGSWGLQIGVEGVDLVMLVMNDKGLQHLLSSKFQLSGEGSVAAGPVGRHASAGTDWKMNTETLTYSRSKGVFAGLTLEGAVVQQDDDSTIAIYNKKVPFRRVLSGKVAAPEVTAEFMQAVAAASHQARVAEAKN